MKVTLVGLRHDGHVCRQNVVVHARMLAPMRCMRSAALAERHTPPRTRLTCLMTCSESYTTFQTSFRALITNIWL